MNFIYSDIASFDMELAMNHMLIQSDGVHSVKDSSDLFKRVTAS